MIAQALLAPLDLRASGKLFVEARCIRCHSVSSQGIERKADPAETEEEEDDDAPDLSEAGAFHEEEFFRLYLRKQVAHTPHAGNEVEKKHKTRFNGSDQDLGQLAVWLSGLGGKASSGIR